MPAKAPVNPTVVAEQLVALGVRIRAQRKARGAYGEAIANDLDAPSSDCRIARTGWSVACR